MPPSSTPPSSSATHPKIIQVAVPTPLRRLFDYLPPASTEFAITIGARVKVPFGNRSVVGIVVDTASHSDVATDKLKRVQEVIDTSPCLPKSLFDSLLWASNYYQHPVGEVFHTALPLKIRQGSAVIKQEAYWRAANDENLETALTKLGRASRQKELLQLISESNGLSTDNISNEGFDTSLLKKLETNGFIEKILRSDNQSSSSSSKQESQPSSIQLNDEQSRALREIDSQDGFACLLLNGVTGSGKTEVYMRAMENHLAAGKQCLLLIPEIGLTPQTVARFEKRFASPIVTLHSNLSDGERLSAWRQARSGQAGIIIGTRSAVFTPMANPGLIIVDEEHDTSFKQQEGFRYSARDFAIKRAQADNIPIVLGSATPSLESLNNVANNKYIHLQLEQRAGCAKQSPMQIVDVAETSLDHGFSEQLLFKIEQHLAANNQVLIFINRRGYAPLLQCTQCAWIAECEDCVAQFTVHSQPPALRCHHCEKVNPIPRSCPHCGSESLQTLGVGTQKLEQYLQHRFTQQPVIRIDRDSTRNRKNWQQLIEKINTGEPAILLGTQMLAKGHHFPHVTLVAIMDADIGLFSADFRGQEQMAQTIVQVAGRAGREDKPGEVIIQSRHAGHPALERLTNLAYTDYAKLLLEERRTAHMPPFSHLSLIRVEGKHIQPTLDLANEITTCATRLAANLVEILGPIPAPMEKKAGKYRLHILAKASNRGALQHFLSELCAKLDQNKSHSRARWILDVDPVDLI